MSVLKREELMNSIKQRLGDDASDNTIKLIEDINDTLIDMETKSLNEAKWEQKYRDNDAEWRKRYKDRFFAPTEDGASDYDNESKRDDKELTYDNLFKEETK